MSRTLTHLRWKSICLTSLVWVCGAQEAPSDDAELFGRIRLLAQDDSADGNKKLDGFLKSLTPAQMLSAARQGNPGGNPGGQSWGNPGVGAHLDVSDHLFQTVNAAVEGRTRDFDAADGWDLQGGSCVHEDLPAGTPCRADVCQGGGPTNPPVDCDNGNPCTEDSCDPAACTFYCPCVFECIGQDCSLEVLTPDVYVCPGGTGVIEYRVINPAPCPQTLLATLAADPNNPIDISDIYPSTQVRPFPSYRTRRVDEQGAHPLVALSRSQAGPFPSNRTAPEPRPRIMRRR